MNKLHNYRTRSLYFPGRITEAMQGIFNHPLTIVEAPMGYGKTTAVREHLQNTDAHVLWQRVYDNDTTGLWNSFCRQLSTLDGERPRSLARLGFPDDAVSLREALHILENMQFPRKTVLVIDDYHLISSPKVDKFIGLLAQTEITNLHIVLAARFTEFTNLEELTLKGYLHYITKKTFELLPNEIMAYYRLCGISLSAYDTDNLYSLTEGWISALYLLMLDFIAKGTYPAMDNIYSLLERAVYRPLSDDIKEFLLAMCIFDGFTRQQAFHMWEKKNADSLLTEIINKNTFVEYDTRTKTYHIHGIFSGFLRDILESRNIKLALLSKAGHWFLSTGNYRLAMHYFYLCGDFDKLYFAFEEEKASGINFEHKKDLLIRYFLECPDDVKVKHPFAILIIAFRLYSYNEIDLFRKACQYFSHIIQMDGVLPDNHRSRLLGEYELLMSFTAYNRINEMAEHHRRASTLLKEPSSFLYSNAIWTFGSPSVLYMFYRETGKLAVHVRDLAENMPLYNRLTSGNGAGAGDIMRAEWHFTQGDAENAEILVYQAMHEARSHKQTASLICALFLEARINLMKGNFPRVSAILQNMRQEITDTGEYLLIHAVELVEGYIYSLLRQSDRIPKWLGEGDFSSDRLLFPVYAMLNIVHGRALLIKGETSKLLGSAQHFNAIASVFPNLLGQIYSYIYLSAANRQILRQHEALAALKQALDIAMPDRVYLPFVENCDYLRPLLEDLYGLGCYREEIAVVLALSGSHQKAVNQILSEHFTGNKPRLTEREAEIARLAAQGFSNRKIGEKLFISENTVKTQLKSIYYKLDIKSRALLKHHIPDH